METAAPIVFFDIAGPDQRKLRAFYADTFGWNIGTHGEISPDTTGGMPGVIRKDPPEKILYLGVADIPRTLEKIKAAGGKVSLPRTVVPGVVTFALFEDPAGNRMGLAELGSYPAAKKKAG